MKRSRYPRRVAMVQKWHGVWVVRGEYRHYWPNGDACTVDLSAGYTRREAAWRAFREVVAR